YRPRHAREWVRQAHRGQASGTDLQTVIIGEPGSGLPGADPSAGNPTGLLGTIGLSGIDPATGRCAVGYWTAPWARRRGVATRALRLICAHAFNDLGVARIEA